MGFFDDLLGTDPKTKARKQTKRAILDRLEIADLKGVCKAYGVGEPSQWTTDFLSGERSRRKVTREHWIELANSDLKLEQLVAYCDKKRIGIKDLLGDSAPLPQETRPRSPKAPAPSPSLERTAGPVANFTEAAPKPMPSGNASPLQTLIRDLEAFEPEDIRDEEDLEKQLIQYLKLKFAGKVERQVPTLKGKIDIVLDRRFAIELKLAESVQKLRNLIGQALDYKKLFDHTIVLIVDVGAVGAPIMNEFLADFRKYGIVPVVIDGDLRRRKTRGGGWDLRVRR